MTTYVNITQAIMGTPQIIYLPIPGPISTEDCLKQRQDNSFWITITFGPTAITLNIFIPPFISKMVYKF